MRRLQVETGTQLVLRAAYSCGLSVCDVSLDLREDTSNGSIDTTGLAAGHYVLVLVPGNVNVLRSDVDLRREPDRQRGQGLRTVSGSDAIEFDIVGGMRPGPAASTFTSSRT